MLKDLRGLTTGLERPLVGALFAGILKFAAPTKFASLEIFPDADPAEVVLTSVFFWVLDWFNLLPVTFVGKSLSPFDSTTGEDSDGPLHSPTSALPDASFGDGKGHPNPTTKSRCGDAANDRGSGRGTGDDTDLAGEKLSPLAVLDTGVEKTPPMSESGRCRSFRWRVRRGSGSLRRPKNELAGSLRTLCGDEVDLGDEDDEEGELDGFHQGIAVATVAHGMVEVKLGGFMPMKP